MNKNWTVCIDSESSLKTLEDGMFQHPMPNEIYDLAAELQEQAKQRMLCKVLPYTGIVGNEKPAKEAKNNITWISKTILTHTECSLSI